MPFPTDVFRLKEVGVCGVVTLNESYETLVPTSLYHVSVPTYTIYSYTYSLNVACGISNLSLHLFCRIFIVYIDFFI